MRNRRWNPAAALFVATTALLPMSCGAVAEIAQSARDPDFHGHIARVAVVVNRVYPIEDALPELITAEFARRKIACLAFVSSGPADLAARKPEIEAFGPEAWMRVVPRDRVFLTSGELNEAHYEASLISSPGTSRWIWRADVQSRGQSTQAGIQERLKVLAVRIVDELAIAHLLEGS